MRYYLVIYHRREGKVIRHHGFNEPEAALAARFDAEREFRLNPHIEVVVLGAESWEAVPLTHGRYFKSVHELVGVARSRIDREVSP
jgi:hypothetical protein